MTSLYNPKTKGEWIPCAVLAEKRYLRYFKIKESFFHGQGAGYGYVYEFSDDIGQEEFLRINDPIKDDAIRSNKISEPILSQKSVQENQQSEDWLNNFVREIIIEKGWKETPELIKRIKESYEKNKGNV